MSKYEWDFFIAHAGADKSAAEELFDLLEPSARVFLDTKRLELGDNWDRVLAEAQKKSLMTVVLVSHKTEAAYYEREEIAAAIALARSDKETHRVVPIYLDPSAASNETLPYGLRLKHGLELSGDQGLPFAATKLLDLLSRLALTPRRFPTKKTVAPADPLVVHIVSTEEDLADARSAVSAHLRDVWGLEVIEGLKPTLGTKVDILILLQGLRWEDGVAADIWNATTEGEKVAFCVEEDGDWPPARLFEFDSAARISEFKGQLKESISFGHPNELPEKVGEHIGRLVAERGAETAKGLTSVERAYLGFRLPSWRSGYTAEGQRHLIDIEGTPETYRPHQYVSIEGTVEGWGENADGIIIQEVVQQSSNEEGGRHGRLRQRLPLARWISAPDLKQTALVGLPGGGKTVFLTRIAAALAAIHLGRGEQLERELNLEGIRNDEGALPIPIVIEATRLASTSQVSLASLADAITDEMCSGHPDAELDRRDVLEALRQGRYILLVDALDEVWQPESRTRLLGLLKAMSSNHPSTRIVLTTRSGRYTGALSFDPEFTVVRLEEFSRDQEEEFCLSWSRAYGRDDDHTARLLAAVEAVGRLGKGAGSAGSLTGTPLMLSAICMVFEKHGALPDDRGQLCTVLVDDLCRSRRSEDMEKGWRLDSDDKRRLLEQIAFAMQREGAQSWRVDRANQEALTFLPDSLSDAPARAARYVNWLAEHTGLIRFQHSLGGEEIRFWHRLFREFLAAKCLAERDETVSALVRSLFEQEHLTDPAWTDVIRLLPRAMGSVSKARGLWEALFGLAQESGQPGRLLGLAQSALIESRGLFAGIDTDHIARELADLYETSGGAWPHEDRVFFLDALGRLDPALGDPRLEKERWIHVPGTCVGIEERKKLGLEERVATKSIHHRSFSEPSSAFMIAWAPVTVQEFRAYVDHPDFKEKKWYTMGQPRSGRSDPLYAERAIESQLEHPNWPITGLDYFDIEAYCKWRTSQRDDGRKVLLPSEEEWDAAAFNGLSREEFDQHESQEYDKGPIGASLPHGVSRPTDLTGGGAELTVSYSSSDGYDGHHLVTRGGRSLTYRIESDMTSGNHKFRVVLLPAL